VKQGGKKKIIERLVDVPEKGKRPFWAREMTLLNRLLDRWPNLDFWSKVRFREKFPSLAYLLTKIGIGNVRRKYNEFIFDIPAFKTYNLGDKVGEDVENHPKPKSLKNFLNNE
tara:strand:+ start:131 stop:469 length:339 start_codon:yes stop_codon:yes gene_type:complete